MIGSSGPKSPQPRKKSSGARLLESCVESPRNLPLIRSAGIFRTTVCHPGRTEGSAVRAGKTQIPRCARNDRTRVVQTFIESAIAACRALTRNLEPVSSGFRSRTAVRLDAVFTDPCQHLLPACLQSDACELNRLHSIEGATRLRVLCAVIAL